MKGNALSLTLAWLALMGAAAFSQQAAVDSPATLAAGRELVKAAQDTLAPIGEEPGDVEDEEAGRPPTAVSDGVFRSSRPNDAAMDRLYELGVRHILNLESREHFAREREALDRARARRAASGKPAWRIESHSVPMSGVHPMTFSQLDAALAVLGDPAERPVLVHCKHGEDRTGVVVAAYRVAIERKKSIDEAVAEAKSLRCCHLVMPGEYSLSRFLDRYLRRR